MKSKLIIMLGLALMLSLSACTSTDRRDVGMVTGGVVGGVAGHALTGGSTAGTIIGAVGGAFVGNKVAQ